MANKIQSFTTTESTSSRQTLTITLENLKNIVSITPNTGSATYTVDGDNVTIQLSGGSYSRRSSYDYWVSEDRWDRTNVYGGYSDRIGIWEWTGTTWSYKHTINAPGNYDPPPRMDYQDSRYGRTYEGVLFNYKRTVSYDNKNYNSPPSNPSVGDTYIKTKTITDYYYEGQIVAPGYWDWSYRYYYQYDVVVEYEEKGIDLSTSATNISQPIVVNVHRNVENITTDIELFVIDELGGDKLVKTMVDVNGEININLTSAEKDILFSNSTNKKYINYYIKATSTLNGEVFSDITPHVKIDFVGVEPVIGTVTYRDIDNLATTITSNDQVIIQGKSKLQVTFSDLRAKSYATLTNLSIVIENTIRNFTDFRYKNFNFNEVNAVKDTTAQITVRDSRGYVVTHTLPIKIEPYSLPIITMLRTYRTNGFEKDSFLDYDVRFAKVVQDFVELNFRIREPNMAWGSWTTIKNYYEYVGDYLNIIGDSLPIGSLDNEKDFEVQLWAKGPYGEIREIILLEKGVGLVVIDKDGWEFQSKAKGVSGISEESNYLATLSDVGVIDGGSLEEDYTLQNGAIHIIGGNINGN